MANRFVFTGLEELKAELRTLPADLTAEASHIVEAAANGAAATIKASYPPGELQDSLSVQVSVSGFAAGAVVKNTSKLASIYENGTEARHYTTVHGVRHETGRMPPKNVFIPTMQRKRAQMYDQLADLLVSHGLAVSGRA
jgi:hypothetical protein